ncbi:NPCBM/NEW2 domain-containing protein [Armatimonas sp.]|uniref:NPCBM/NEW2 domain-containing protein n=1 Tax=Armatimonas sp. TaxID=1872638 RepID=UPI0037510CED
MTRRRFAVALFGLSLSVRATAQQDPSVVIVPVNPLENPGGEVWLESLFKAPGVRYDGNLVFSPRKVLVNGKRFEHGMSADVKDDPMGPGEICGMTIPVQGKFLRFQAMVGRDDDEAKLGTGYCYFEVYGDNKLLFRSDAIRSTLYPVLTDEGGAKRTRPQPVDLEIKGVRLLRLIVRYANDFKQTGTFAAGPTGDHVKRAAGCIWYDSKLISGAGATLDTARLKERDERIRTAAQLAARSLKRQLQVLEKPGTKFPLIILPIRDESRVSPDDLLIRPQIAKVFFGSDDGRPLGVPLEPEKTVELREILRNFSPKSLRELARAAEQGRYANAPYLIGGYIENERLYLILLDTRPDDGQIVGNATGWLSPP